MGPLELGLFAWGGLCAIPFTRPIASAPLLALLGPPLLLSTFRLGGSPVLEPLDPALAELPEAARRHFDRVGSVLAGEGFNSACCWRISDYLPNLAGYYEVYASARESTAAMAAAAFVCSGACARDARAHHAFVEFVTEYEGDAGVNTLNSRELPTGSQPPRLARLHLRGHDDVGELLRLHRALVRRAGRGRLRALPAADGWEDRVRESLDKYARHNVETGFLRPDPASRAYRLTPRGAALAAWSNTWPFQQIRTRRADRAAHRLKRELAA
jgi:hypothetical protein